MNLDKSGTELSKFLPITIAHILVEGIIFSFRVHSLKEKDMEQIIEDNMEHLEKEYEEYKLIFTYINSNIKSSTLHAKLNDDDNYQKGIKYSIDMYALKIPLNLVHFLLTQNYYKDVIFYCVNSAYKNKTNVKLYLNKISPHTIPSNMLSVRFNPNSVSLTMSQLYQQWSLKLLNRGWVFQPRSKRRPYYKK